MNPKNIPLLHTGFVEIQMQFKRSKKKFQEHCLTMHELLPRTEPVRHRILQGVSKMFRQNQKVKVQINVCSEMSGFWAYSKDYFKKIRTLTMHILLATDMIIYNIRPQFNNCWDIIVYRVTTYNNFSKCPPAESRHAWTRQIMDCRALSRLPGSLQIVWQAPKLHG
jgi:hypothetical protein